jgi:hypothetical protein
MFVHCVYFWLKPDLTPDQRRRFEEDVKTLSRVPAAVHCWIGTPADTDRPVIDRTYSYGLVVCFNDKAGHDAYQIDPIHEAFADSCKQFWNQVKIYDFE